MGIFVDLWHWQQSLSWRGILILITALVWIFGLSLLWITATRAPFEEGYRLPRRETWRHVHRGPLPSTQRNPVAAVPNLDDVA